MNNKYTKEQDNWLKENAPKLSRKGATDLFNAKFNQCRSESSIKVHCNKILKIGFRNIKYDNSLPIGTERIRGGYIWVKIKDDMPKPGEYAGYINWKQKAQIVYESVYGKIPDNYLIVFLNRDTLDCRIENLYAISPRVNREMSKKNWWSSNPELTLTAIKWCELFYALKDVKTMDK